MSAIKKRKILWLMLTAFAIGVLAGFSYLATEINVDGEFPSAVIRIHVNNQAGHPVKGAVIKIYSEQTHELMDDMASNFPKSLMPKELVSDDSGTITLTHVSQGIEQSYIQGNLFFLIPIRTRTATWIGEISASGYKPVRFPLMQLFEAKDRDALLKTRIKTEIGDKDVSIYEQAFVLSP